MAGRILGMGDVVTLVEKAQEHFDAAESVKLQKKMAKGSFGFDDFLKQMQAVKKMGGIKDMMKMMPGMGGQLDDLDLDGAEIGQMEAIVHSMTLKERRDPDLIDLSRRRRIAAGAGVQVHDVSSLVKTFKRSRDQQRHAQETQRRRPRRAWKPAQGRPEYGCAEPDDVVGPKDQAALEAKKSHTAKRKD